MSAMKEAALEYAEKGWNVFPVRPNKKPYTKHGYQDATTNVDQIGEWWETWPDANIGFCPGDASMLVFDIDPGATIETLNRALDGYLPDTPLQARTPRGGHHLYYVLDPGEEVRPSASQVAKHIDVRSSGSYVLLPPSTTDAGEYAWIGADGHNERPKRRTDAMMSVVKQKRERDPHADQWLVAPDQPENTAACIGWLRDVAQPALQGQGGDEMTFKTAAMCRSYGISEQAALDLMFDHWNDRCEPAWDYDDLSVKVRNAYEYPTSPAGNVTAEGRAKQLGMETVVKEERDDDGAIAWTFEGLGMRGVNRAAMNKIEQPKWLVDNMIPHDGYVIMYAPYSSYKTFIALDLALSIASGIVEDPVHPVKLAGPVVYFAGEGRSNLTARVAAWEKRHRKGLQTDNFWLFDPAPKIDTDYTAVFDRLKSVHPEGVRLVVIDTLSRSLQGENENTQEVATKFTKLVEMTQRSLNCAVMVIHHTGKNDTIRGSSAFGGDVDAMYRINPLPGQKAASIRMDKIKDGTPWEAELQVSLEEVDETLVAVPVTRGHRALFEQGKGNLKIATEILNEIIIETCRSRPGHTFTANEMASALADRDDVEVGAEALRKRLKMIKDNPSEEIEGYLVGKGFTYEV